MCRWRPRRGGAKIGWLEKIRHLLTAAGFDEALTLSVVDEQNVGVFQSVDQGRAAAEPDSGDPRGRLSFRRSLVPSLLAARRTNEALAKRGNRVVRDRQGVFTTKR